MDMPALITLSVIVCLGMVGSGFGCYMWGYTRGKEETDYRYQAERERRTQQVNQAIKDVASVQNQREKELQRQIEQIRGHVASVGPNPTPEEIKLLLERVSK